MFSRPALPKLPALPRSLTRRFALAAAGLASGTLLLTSLASWWLLNRQHETAYQELAARERQFHAQTVGLNLTALAARMSEVAGSTILATGLVDSAGKETYLQPFLDGLRQVNGIPVQVLFTDFEGGEIANNNGQFSDEQREWLSAQLKVGKSASAIFHNGGAPELVALEPLVYPRTTTPEGGLLYKVLLDSVHVHQHMKLLWGAELPADQRQTSPVAAPVVFENLGFRILGEPNVQEGMDALSPQYLPITLLTLGLFLAVVLAGARLASLLTRDLRQLQAFAGDLVRDGLSQERVHTSGTEEVASLSESINKMLDRLYEQRQALTREREKLMDLTDALKRADKRKDEFVAMLAHELRNPLAPIMTGAEMLRHASGGDPMVEDTGRIIGNQARHMARIIDDLLDISRITRGQVTLKLETIDLATVTAVAIEQIQPLIASSRHQFSVDVPTGPLPVRGDHARLVQVVSNLLNNAAKYTPQGGYIDLRTVEEDDEWHLSVGDNGSGIDPDLMPEIFDLFTQGERSSDRRQGGLGLGLALVKSLVAMHGGRVTAESPGLGYGSRFHVYLPIAPLADLKTPPPTPSLSLGPAASPAHRLKLHLVDDNVDAAQTLAMLLEMDGYEVSVSYDATSTLAKVAEIVKEQARMPDVFILDIGLPDMDGTDLSRRLRDLPAVSQATLIALTGYGQGADVARSLAAGFDHHLVKPVDYERLTKLLAQFHSPDRVREPYETV